MSKDKAFASDPLGNHAESRCLKWGRHLHPTSRPFFTARTTEYLSDTHERAGAHHMISSQAERFGQAGVPKENISMARETYHFESPDQGPAAFIDSFRRFYGPTMSAFEAAGKNGRVEELYNQLLELAKSQNKSANGGTSIPAVFLRITVSV
jgi:hypothetical protein